MAGAMEAFNEIHLYREGIVVVGHGRAQHLRLIPYSTLQQQAQRSAVQVEASFLDDEGNEH